MSNHNMVKKKQDVIVCFSRTLCTYSSSVPKHTEPSTAFSASGAHLIQRLFQDIGSMVIYFTKLLSKIIDVKKMCHCQYSECEKSPAFQ